MQTAKKKIKPPFRPFLCSFERIRFQIGEKNNRNAARDDEKTRES